MSIGGRGEKRPPELLRPLEKAYVEAWMAMAEALAEYGDDELEGVVVEYANATDPSGARAKIRAAAARAVRKARAEHSSRAMVQAARAQWERITTLSERVADREFAKATRGDSVSRRDAIKDRIKAAKERAEKRISEALRRQFEREQTRLYTSLSVEWAGKLADHLEEAIRAGRGAAALREAIERVADMTENRATLIGENETQRWFASQTEIRYSEAGVSKYVWRTQRDSRVRDLHREYEGEVFAWDEDGLDLPPGSAPNCRCWAEPIITFDEEE
jgi:SPP1 gp7 family putative phage head morphogenesis protein